VSRAEDDTNRQILYMYPETNRSNRITSSRLTFRLNIPGPRHDGAVVGDFTSLCTYPGYCMDPE
jgi:hypothetical protein